MLVRNGDILTPKHTYCISEIYYNPDGWSLEKGSLWEVVDTSDSSGRCRLVRLNKDLTQTNTSNYVNNLSIDEVLIDEIFEKRKI